MTKVSRPDARRVAPTGEHDTTATTTDLFGEAG